MSIILEQTSDQIKHSISLHTHAEIRSVHLVRSGIDRHIGDIEWTQPLNMKLAYSLADTALSECSLRVDIDFVLHIRDNSSPNSGSLDVTATFEAEYELENDFRPSKEELDAFSSGNAVYNCWPYFREYVQNVAARAAVPGVVIPFLRVKATSSAAVEEEADADLDDNETENLG